MLAYFLKVNVAIVLFYAFYRLFFYKDTFFGWRRTALLCFFALSAACPLLNIQTWIASQEPMAAMADLYASVLLPELTLTPQTESVASWKIVILNFTGIVYWGIVATLFIRFLIQLGGIIRLTYQCKVREINGNIVHLLDRPNGPFSFFHWIFIHMDSHSKEEIDEILTHEQTHVRQWHSVDVIISEVVCILCWFNPFAWLMKREIRTNLEYMADARVLENGYDSKTYQYHLLGLSHHKAAVTIYNSFNVLPLKKRIKMMNKKRTKEIGRTKYLMFLPLAALLMIVSNIETVARTTEKFAADVMENAAPEMTTSPLPVVQDTVDISNAVFEIVEVMPVFPGGMSALMKYLGENIKYPEEAKKKNMQGRVYVAFIVNQDGSISDTRIIRGASPLLDAEALRVIGSMPKWKPGMQKGKAVRVQYSVPVVFSLKKQKGGDITAHSAQFVPKEIKPDANGIYEVAEEMPQFPGGMGKLMEYISKNMQYPAEAQKQKVEGRVVVQMVVDAEGNVTNPRILQGVNPLLDKEALRLMKDMPKWTPGKQNGEAVAVKYTLPVMFQLQ